MNPLTTGFVFTCLWCRLDDDGAAASQWKNSKPPPAPHQLLQWMPNLWRGDLSPMSCAAALFLRALRTPSGMNPLTTGFVFTCLWCRLDDDGAAAVSIANALDHPPAHRQFLVDA
jgi:hypothetical protein